MSILAIVAPIFLDGAAAGRTPLIYTALGSLLLGKGLIDATGRRACGSRLSIATAVGCACVAALLIWVACDSLVSQMDGLGKARELGRYMTLHLDAHPGDRLTRAPLAIGLVAILGAFAGWMLGRPAERPLTTVATHAARVAAAILALLVGVAALDAVRRPSLDAYLGALEPVGHAEIPGEPRRAGMSGVPTDFGPGKLGLRSQRMGPFTLLQNCAAAGCYLELEEGDVSPPARHSIITNGPLQGWDSDLDLVRDPIDGAVFAIGVAAEFHRVGTLDLPRPPRQVLGTFRESGGSWTSSKYDRSSWLHRTSLPRQWLFGAAAGLLLVTGLLVLRRRVRRAMARAEYDIWICLSATLAAGPLVVALVL